MVFIIVLLFILIIIGAIIMVLKTYKKMEATGDTSVDEQIATAVDFLPFKTISDGMIDLGDYDYRVVIECSSINYNLKTEQEKEIIEASFGRFVNSLQFPIVFYIQTRRINNQKILLDTKEQANEAVMKYPKMKEYAESYLKDLANLNDYIGNNKQKKKYIIVPYSEAVNLQDLSPSEKREYSLKEIQNRALFVQDSLMAVGIKSKILNTKELAELIYSAYHKDNYSDFENIANGSFLSLIVSSKDNPQRDISDEARLDWILYETQNRISNELLGKALTEEQQQVYENIINDIAYMRDRI